MNIEKQSPFPEIHLFPRLEAVAGAVGTLVKRFVSFCPLQSPDYMSNHYRGAAATLDHALYDGQQVLWNDPIEPTTLV